MYDEVVSVRLNAKSIEEIDRLINEGDFSTRGEFVKYAVRQTLKRYEGRSPPPLVTESPQDFLFSTSKVVKVPNGDADWKHAAVPGGLVSISSVRRRQYPLRPGRSHGSV